MDPQVERVANQDRALKHCRYSILAAKSLRESIIGSHLGEMTSTPRAPRRCTLFG